MKFALPIWKVSLATTVLLLGCSVSGWAAKTNAPTGNIVAQARTADSGKATAAAKPAASVRAILEQPLPVSQFVVPREVEEGKDPFHPRSTRVYRTDAPKAAEKPTVTVELSLRGMSGSADRPLAIINNVTFAVGESSDVVSRGNRLRVTCLGIDMTTGTAVVQVGSEQRTLRLQP